MKNLSKITKYPQNDGFGKYLESINKAVKLVTEDNSNENAVKEMAQQESKEEDEDVEDEILTLAEADALKDEDFIEYNEFLEKESDDDNNLIKEGD